MSSLRSHLVRVRLFLFPLGSIRDEFYTTRLRPIVRALLWRKSSNFKTLYHAHNGDRYLNPTDLRLSEVHPRRVLIVGSCLAEGWGARLPCPFDFVVTNHLNELSDCPPREPNEYDLQVIQLPLRLILPDGALWRIAYSDTQSYQQVFDAVVQKMQLYLQMAAKWNRLYNIPTLVSNFLSPQQHSVGHLLPLYDLRNPTYFVDQLNVDLAKEVSSYSNMYVLDINGIAASIGKQHIQDDAVELESHASLLSPVHYEKDRERLEPIPRVEYHYDLQGDAFFSALGRRILSDFRILVQADAVKLVIIDLDNTLWRGVPAEEGVVDAKNTEGWPLGFMEALFYLKKRGIVLAIASKNDERLLRELWPQLTQGRMALEDFAVVKINWLPKTKNVQEILTAVNVLPRHTIFIDDNPVERAAIREAFPDIRTLGTYPYYLKRVLLWSSETQVASISSESAERTQLIQARVERESLRSRMSRAEFLSTLNVSVEITEIRSITHSRFGRAFELINKTNQFNTTGRRWTQPECITFFEAGGVFLVFSAKDRYSEYGLIGCAILDNFTIQQLVMSCRVIGLDIENQVITHIEAKALQEGAAQIVACLLETEANYPCRDMYSRCGFTLEHERWWSKPIKKMHSTEDSTAHASVGQSVD